MNDSAQGRKHLGSRGPIRGLSRAFAAVGLGYLGVPETRGALCDLAANARISDTNLRAAAVTALGLFEDDREEITAFLLGMLKDKRLDDLVRAQVPISLARLGAEAAVPELLARFESRRDSNDRLRESLTVALGRLASIEDREVLAALQRAVEDAAEPQVRHFAMIAQAEIAARAGAPDGEAIQGISKQLLRELTRPSRSGHRPWAAIASALIARELADHSNLRGTILTKLAEEFESENNPSFKSGIAIGLGLARAPREAAELVHRELADTREPTLLGYLALSLGMMRHSVALTDLRELVLDNRGETLRLQAATALGLLGDRDVSDQLVAELRDAETLTLITSIARAVGLIGDKRAIDPLREIIADEAKSGIVRGFACSALGLLAEKGELTWNTPIIDGANYRLELPFFHEIADIL